MVLPQARLRVWAPLCVGLLVLAVTDSSYVTQTFTGTFRSGGMTDLGWLVSFLLVALAARVPAAESELSVQDDIGDAPSLAQEVLPYAALALAAWAYVTTPSAIDHPGRYLWLTGPLALAVGVRQLLVVADHLTLARDLGAAVERRTSQLLHRDQWWKDLVANLSDVVIVVGVDGVVGYISPSAHTSLSHWQRLADATDLQAQVHPEDRRSTFDTIRPVLEGEGRNGFVECRLRRADGSWGWFEVTAVGQLDGRALQGAVLTLHDVSDSHQLTDRLTHQAYHDALTGLPNRALLMERLDAALAHDDGTGLRAAADGPRRLQGDQRPARARLGRRRAGGDRHPPRRDRARQRHGGPARRRRVRAAALRHPRVRATHRRTAHRADRPADRGRRPPVPGAGQHRRGLPGPPATSRRRTRCSRTPTSRSTRPRPATRAGSW